MNKIRTKIKERLSDFMDWIEYGLHRLYGKPTMMKQFIIVLILGSSLSIFSIYTLVRSIYNIGRADAMNDWIEVNHIRDLERYDSNDSIQSIKNYELKIKN